jgi:sec-independent protein translocase protein TatB
MFDIGWSELVVIGVVALIAIGPKELPGVLRAVGQWTGKIRRMAAEFQGQFQEALREAEMADLKKQVDDLGEAARGLTSFNPADYDPSKWQPPAATPEPSPESAVPAPAETPPAAASEAAPPSPEAAPEKKIESPPSAATGSAPA